MDRPIEVHWHEGMFLRPHHMQVAFRDLRAHLRREAERIRPYSYGVGQLKLDPAQLSNDEFEITACDVLFPSGQWVSVPDNAKVSSRNFALIRKERRAALDVFLGIPVLAERDPNVLDSEARGSQQVRRYGLRENQIYDENTGTNPQTLETRYLCAQILFEGEAQAGFEVVRIARLSPTSGAKSDAVLDPAFIPPLLLLDSWPPALAMVRELSQAFRHSTAELEAQIARREIPIGSEAVGGVETAMKLQVLHRGNVLLFQMVQNPRFHPQEVYLELCRLAADLCSFGPSHALPQDLPAYDHEDLGGCFGPVVELLHKLLESVIPRSYERQQFEQRGEQMECPLKDDWLDPACPLFIAVRADRDPAELRKFMDTKVVKVASPLMAERVVRGRLLGIDIRPVERLPAGLPDYADVQYFKMERGDKKDEFWDGILKEKCVVISGAPRERGVEYWLYVLLKAPRSRTR